MHALFFVVTALGALMTGYAAYLNFSGAESVKEVADRIRVPRSWMVPLGTVLATASVGLLIGLALWPVAAAAAAGLVAYFCLALVAHLRVGDRQLGGALFFLLVAACSLVTNLVSHRGG